MHSQTLNTDDVIDFADFLLDVSEGALIIPSDDADATEILQPPGRDDGFFFCYTDVAKLLDSKNLAVVDGDPSYNPGHYLIFIDLDVQDDEATPINQCASYLAGLEVRGEVVWMPTSEFIHHPDNDYQRNMLAKTPENERGAEFWLVGSECSQLES